MSSSFFMVAFSPADIPSSIDTLEKLSVWCSTVLQHLHPEQTVLEAPGITELVATASPYQIIVNGDFTWRNIARQSIELNPNWQRGATKLWTHALPLSTQAIPVEFKS